MFQERILSDPLVNLLVDLYELLDLFCLIFALLDLDITWAWPICRLLLNIFPFCLVYVQLDVLLVKVILMYHLEMVQYALVFGREVHLFEYLRGFIVQVL